MYDWATPVRILIVFALTITALLVAAIRTSRPPKPRINFSAALTAHPPAQLLCEPRHYRSADPEDSVVAQKEEKERYGQAWDNLNLCQGILPSKWIVAQHS